MFHLRLGAGLGNRLFQYASVKGFASKLNMEVNLIQIENTFHETNNSYKWFNEKISNDIKNISIDFANSENIVNSEYLIYDQPYEEHLDCETSIEQFKNKKHIKIFGYFQYEKNFLHIRNELLDIFKERHEITKELHKYEYSLPCNFSEITLLHIRLGDYINCPKHFVNLENYYMKCITKLRETNNKLTILILCEDPHHIQNVYKSLFNFIIENDCLIIKSPNNHNSVEFDLYLMTRCKNIICSNSTFAWWGAWLNSNPEKKVFIPNKWLNDRPYIINMEGAIKMDV